MHLTSHYATHLPQAGAPLSTESVPHFPTLQLVVLNEPLAREFGLDPAWLRSPEGLDFLAYGIRPDGASPMAMAYAGHQFGQFVPSLGDGRARLVGELRSQDGQIFDLHLKGSGPTPFSRGGDGKCPLGPALREYLLSEAMAHLGIPTTRALAVLTTGENLERDGQYQPGAVIARIGQSFIRVGSFQYFSTRGDEESLQKLADFAIERLCPEAHKSATPYLTLLKHVAEKQAFLIAQWMRVGFIHGVMNTDNMALSGETLDYGPCAFLDAYDPVKHFSFIDTQGRYSYGQQPQVALWNLTRLAEALLPLLGKTEQDSIAAAKEILNGFDSLFSHYWLEAFRHKLGLLTPQEDDVQLLEHLLETMHHGGADFTNVFRILSRNKPVFKTDYHQVRKLFPKNKGHMDLCYTNIMARLLKETASPAERQALMRDTNPRLIPRNHQVAKAINEALTGDFHQFHHLYNALKTPYSCVSADTLLDLPPMKEEQVQRTYCGT